MQIVHITLDWAQSCFYTERENKVEHIRYHLLAAAMSGQYQKGKAFLCVLSAGEFRSALCC